jgi:spermidine/putrescine transport system ATP-binding protein
MIKLDNVYKSFNSKGIAGLNGINLEIFRGEIFSLLGANGSGKTTLLNIISGTLTPDRGEVFFQETAAFYQDMKITADQVVQQFLVSKVLITNEEDKKIQLSRDMADIFEFTFQLKQKFSELSAGQKQKVLLASFLINSPKAILLDEPFTHLDPFTRNSILKSLFEALKRSQTTAIWVTHDLKEAFEFSDRVAIINFGKIEQVADPIQLSLNPRNLFVAQFLGHKNFIPFNLENHLCNSEFGSYSSSRQDSPSEGYLIVPPTSWRAEPSAPNLKIERIFSRGDDILLELSNGSRYIWVTSRPSWGNLKPGDSLNLAPVFEECLTIPL